MHCCWRTCTRRRSCVSEKTRECCSASRPHRYPAALHAWMAPLTLAHTRAKRFSIFGPAIAHVARCPRRAGLLQITHCFACSRRSAAYSASRLMVSQSPPLRTAFCNTQARNKRVLRGPCRHHQAALAAEARRSGVRAHGGAPRGPVARCLPCQPFCERGGDHRHVCRAGLQRPSLIPRVDVGQPHRCRLFRVAQRL